jgi:hypothetical protein
VSHESRRVGARRTTAAGLLALLAVLTACGGDDNGTAGSDAPREEAAPAAVTPGPELAYADVQLVPGVGEWVREPIDDSVASKQVTAYVDPADNAVVVEVRDYLNGDVTYEPGFVPLYWDDAADREEHDNGFTCATLELGSSCYRLLTDGILEIDCNTGACAKTPDELADISGLFYEAFSGGSVAGGTTDEEEVCGGVDLAVVDELFAPWTDGSAATLDLEGAVAGESYTCYVDFPAGSFGEDGAGLMILRHPYESATVMGSSDCDFGGTTPDEVFTSALSCKEQIDATDEYSAGVQSFPAEGGGGTVVSQNEAVRATDGAYWWQVSLTGVTFGAENADAHNEVAATLP